jgi:hypothetical protein
MTAEIAIFNKSAIALAADSAATITSNGEHKKIYNGSEKLFTLSKHHPVGVMVYNNSDICSAPWELVIKSFRKFNGDKNYKTLVEWTEVFFKFVSDNHAIIDKPMRENSLTYFHYNEIMPSLISEVMALAEKRSLEIGSVITINEYHKIATDYLDQFLVTLAAANFFEDFDDRDTSYATSVISNYLDHICEQFIIHDEAGIPPDLKAKVLDVLSLTSTKKAPVGVTSGIVFAGYGEDEYYPGVLSFDIFGCLGNKIRKIFNLSKSSLGSAANVFPFAQDQEVQLFLKGCYDELLDHCNESYDECHHNTIEKINNILISQLTAEQAEPIIDQILQLTSDLPTETAHKINSFINERYNQRVMSMLNFLPKQELAYMAESLVNLTAFKRKVSDQHETVGGPIDVAIISKTDGFIWVKRKHYFEADLNHHFFTN